MTRNTRLAPIVALASLTALTGMAQAAGIYRCTQADGSITLSDAACPPDTLTREYRGEATSDGRPRSPSKDPWSVMNQVRRVEQREQTERKAAAGRQGRKTDATSASAPNRAGKPSYQEAHRRALEAAGYNEDSQLSKTQRDRVAEEMAKYGYGLREPAKTSSTRKGKAKAQAQGQGDAAAAVPDPPTAVDPRNATLTPHP